MRRLRLVIESGEDTPEIFENCSFGQISTIPRVANVDRVLQKKRMRLLASGFIQRARRIVYLGQQPLCSIQMARDRRIGRLRCDRPVTVDGNNIVSYPTTSLAEYTEHGQQNQGRSR